MTRFQSLRRTLLIGLCAGALAACSGGEDGSAVNTDDLVDMTLGLPTAPVELIEYASTTCPACAGYNNTMHETIKQLADEGKLHFIFREFPRDQVDIAGFAVARCAGDGKYFDVLNDLFDNQQGIAAASRNGTIRVALQAVAERHGMTADAFEACLENTEVRSAISNAARAGEADGVTGTPTLFLDGLELRAPEGRTPESLTELVEQRQPD